MHVVKKQDRRLHLIIIIALWIVTGSPIGLHHYWLSMVYNNTDTVLVCISMFGIPTNPVRKEGQNASVYPAKSAFPWISQSFPT